ncbi:MAG: acyl-CoA dehydrogenase family protein [Burkholderiales bacterium]|jgi:alkylation response protein AidB-like acyl-CoA dehydrogenase|nr:acyl-CoA dehydrogenase family protein [Burkholderiales bacterium]
MTATPDWNQLGDAEFRSRVAAFVQEHCPPSLRHLGRRPRWSEVGGWYTTLARHGWLAPGWPTEWGGMGLHAARHLLYIEEMERCGAPWMPDSGVRNLGPVLIAHGSDDQKRYWLPRILSGTQVWCQGYSEPGAGSDLAGLRTSARVEGDELFITGHKIWTTAAYDATHMFALVRTEPGSVRQAGISFVLLSMDQPGVTVRDIRNIAGEVEFCEVFLDNARTPLANIVGPMNDGWRIAKSLLGFERVWAGSPRKALAALWRTEELARRDHSRLAADAAFVDRLTQMRLDVEDLQSLYQRFAQLLRQGELGPEVSALKVWATETGQRASELLVEAAGGGGLLEDSGPLGAFYDTRAPAIFSGTNQIQRNLIARNVLNLSGKP